MHLAFQRDRFAASLLLSASKRGKKHPSLCSASRDRGRGGEQDCNVHHVCHGGDTDLTWCGATRIHAHLARCRASACGTDGISQWFSVCLHMTASATLESGMSATHTIGGATGDWAGNARGIENLHSIISLFSGHGTAPGRGRVSSSRGGQTTRTPDRGRAGTGIRGLSLVSHTS